MTPTFCCHVCGGAHSSLEHYKRESGSTLAFCPRCAWREFKESVQAAEVAEEMHKLNCPITNRHTREVPNAE